jgi:hypothetical protein
LCIEEPFDFTNTARSTYNGEIFEKIKNVFFLSWKRLKETKSIDSLFQQPLFMQQNVTPYQVHNDAKYIVYAPGSPTHDPFIQPTAADAVPPLSHSPAIAT